LDVLATEIRARISLRAVYSSAARSGEGKDAEDGDMEVLIVLAGY
jgi:hypothetical protein